jgi:polar amino acid transport system substrate-binding protein
VLSFEQFGNEIARRLRMNTRTSSFANSGPPRDIELQAWRRSATFHSSACLKSGDCDVSILGIDPTRIVDVDYSAPFAQLEFTYLVPDGSSIRTIADADRPGVRIAVVRNHVSTLALTRVLKQATPVYAEMIDPAFDLLRTGKAEVFASVRAELVKYATQLPGSRVLDESYGANRFAMAVAKDRAAERLAYMSEFIDEVRASGLLQQIIDHSGLRGLSVLPLMKTN